MEIFRSEWEVGIDPVQWNFVRSAGNVLRGVHLHVVHNDYLVCLSGLMKLGLFDCRPESPTFQRAVMVTLDPSEPCTISVPTGVAHGFYFPVPSTLCYAVTAYWDPLDELGCRWDDPELGLDWDAGTPELSERDRLAGPASEMIDTFLARRAEIDARRPD